jgi:hypothetical protein
MSMTVTVSIRRRLIVYVAIVLVVVGTIWLAAGLLGYWMPLPKLPLLAAICAGGIIILELVALLGVTVDEARIKAFTALIACAATALTFASEVAKRPFTIDQIRNTTTQKTSDIGAPSRSIDPRGEWIGKYTWLDLTTRRKMQWSERVTIETYDSQSQRFEGKAVDTDGQDTRLVGHEYENALVFYYVSNKPNRNSFGSAALEFDNRAGNTLKGMLILKELNQQQIMSGTYEWERQTNPPRSN